MRVLEAREERRLLREAGARVLRHAVAEDLDRDLAPRGELVARVDGREATLAHGASDDEVAEDDALLLLRGELGEELPQVALLDVELAEELLEREEERPGVGDLARAIRKGVRGAEPLAGARGRSPRIRAGDVVDAEVRRDSVEGPALLALDEEPGREERCLRRE